MTTFPLSLPSLTQVQQVTFGHTSNVATTRSPFSAGEQVFEHVGSQFNATVTLTPLSPADAAVWRAFFMKLRGRRGTFLMPDIANRAPRGTMLGTPVVNGAGQTGRNLATSGWTADQTGVALAGDYIGLGSGATARKHMVVEDADADGSGNATLVVEPLLRASPVDGSTVVTTDVMGVYRLSANNVEWDEDVARFHGFSFGCREVV